MNPATRPRFVDEIRQSAKPVGMKGAKGFGMSRWIVLGIALAAPWPASVAAAADGPAALRGVYREWIEVRKTLSAEAAQWIEEQRILADSIRLLEGEIATLEDRIREGREAGASVAGKRDALTGERDGLVATAGALRALLPELEARALALHRRLPQPLQEELAPLVRRIPEDPEKTRAPLAQRFQAIAGILSLADKFNSGISVDTTVRPLADGRSVEVTTLYFGLAGAIYVDATGAEAGVGAPGADGWAWTPAPESAQAILRSVAVHRGDRAAEFVAVPATLD